jgi:hypothetical protein
LQGAVPVAPCDSRCQAGGADAHDGMVSSSPPLPRVGIFLGHGDGPLCAPSRRSAEMEGGREPDGGHCREDARVPEPSDLDPLHRQRIRQRLHLLGSCGPSDPARSGARGDRRACRRHPRDPDPGGYHSQVHRVAEGQILLPHRRPSVPPVFPHRGAVALPHGEGGRRDPHRAGRGEGREQEVGSYRAGVPVSCGRGRRPTRGRGRS